MRSSNILIDKLKEFEGCKLISYKDPKGIWTIGIGHTRGVKKGQIITMAQAESLCRSDLSEMEEYVNRLKLSLTQGQFDALVDFVYNCGIGNFLKSELLRDIKNNVDSDTITKDFMAWTSGGISGLVRRRKWEAEMFNRNKK